MKWIAGCPPEDAKGQFICTCKRTDGNRFVAADALYAPQANMMGNVIAYTEIKHFLDNRDGWKSEYLGDEMVCKTQYLICFEDNKQICCVWNNGTNLQNYNIIAFRELPKPYKGAER